MAGRLLPIWTFSDINIYVGVSALHGRQSCQDLGDIQRMVALQDTVPWHIHNLYLIKFGNELYKVTDGQRCSRPEINTQQLSKLMDKNNNE